MGPDRNRARSPPPTRLLQPTPLFIWELLRSDPQSSRRPGQRSSLLHPRRGLDSVALLRHQQFLSGFFLSLPAANMRLVWVFVAVAALLTGKVEE